MEVAAVVTHLGSEADARAIADTLVAERLAACAHVRGPLWSTYRWRGTVEREPEWELDAVTATDRLDACLARLAALHPYELPALLHHRLTASAEYGAWVHDGTRPDPEA